MTQPNCDTCTELQRLGVNLNGWDAVIALAGNPNTGKSTVFNRLTGLHQHTGNWPGKTVTRAEGGFIFRDRRYRIIDLPGTYSLLSASPDEEVARDFILFGRPNVTVVVVDATRLERNLNLTLQIFEITNRVIVCLNLIDEARRHGLRIDVDALSRKLGVPVIPTAARKGTGIPELLEAIYGVTTGEIECHPHRVQVESPQLKQALDDLMPQIQTAYPNLPNPRWIALRLLEGDPHITEAVRNGNLNTLEETPA